MKRGMTIVTICMLVLWTCLALIVIESENSVSGTVVSGHITSNTTWNLSASPYFIEGDVYVDQGVNLSIEAGVEIRFNGSYSLIIDGNLTALGTPANMINFTSNQSTPWSDDWDRIMVNSTGHADISYCNITYGNYGIYLSGSSNNYIQDNAILNNYNDGIFLHRSSNNTILNNSILDQLINNGIFLDESSGNKIKNNNISNNGWHGIHLFRSSKNIIFNNTVWDNYRGIFGAGSDGAESELNNIAKNSIFSNNEGIRLQDFTKDNNITGNNISTNTVCGVNLTSSSINSIYHNIFFNNAKQAYDDGSNNFWDNGYPKGGNLWSDFDEPGENAFDIYSGPSQTEDGSDGIVDTPYMKIGGDAQAEDRYPLMMSSTERIFVYLSSPINNSVVKPGTILDFIVVGDDIAYVNYSSNGGLNKTLNPPHDINDTDTWPDDRYIIDIFVYDGEGNITEFWFNITIDSIKPEIILNTPSNGSLILPGVKINLTILDENIGIVNYSLDGEPNSTISSPYDIDTQFWMDGNHSIWVYATDMAGNQNYTMYNFSTDGLSPQITMLAPSNNSVIKPGVFLQFEISDPHLNTSFVNYSINGQGPNPFPPPYEIDTTGWSDDNYTIEVNATDDLGNKRRSYFNVTIDSIKPEIILISPFNNSVIEPGDTLDFDVTDANLKSANYRKNYGPEIPLDASFNINTTTWLDGPYRIDIIADDFADNSNSTYYNFTVVTLPVIELITPVNNSIIKEGTLIYFSIEDGNLDEVNYSKNAEENQTLESPYIIDTAGWPDGNYIIEIHAIDLMDNYNSSWYAFTVDSTPPDILLNIYSNNSVILPGIILDFDILDPNLNTVTYSIDGGGPDPFLQPYDIDTDGWEDGTHSIEITATDIAGNENISELNIIVDSTPPIIQLLSPLNGTSCEIGTPINFSIIEDNLDFVNYTVNFGENKTLSSPFSIDTSSWEDGDFIIEVYAIDLVGNSNTSWYTFTLNDTLVPTIALNSPQNGSIISPGTIIDLIIFDKNLRNVNYSLDGAMNIPLESPFDIDTLDWDEGLHALVVHADDLYNHINTSEFVFTIDSSPPSILLISHSNNSVIQPGEVLDFTIEDEHFYSANLSINEDPFQSFPAPFNLNTSGMEDGTYALVITVYDLAGNENTTCFGFIIDSLPPSIILNSPANGSLIKTGTIIDLTITDPNIENVEYSIDDGQKETLLSPYDINTTGLEDGEHFIEIYAVDFAGNSKDASFEFTLDGSPPEVSDIYVSEPYHPFNNTLIQIVFTEPMNKESVVLALTITPDLEYTISWSDDGKTLFLRDITGMQLNKSYTIELGVGAEDMAGNGLLNASSHSFTATTEPTDTDVDKDKEEKSFLDYWWLIPILIALLVISMILFIMLIRERREPEVPEVPEEAEEEEKPKEPKTHVEELEEMYVMLHADEDIKDMEAMLSQEEKFGDRIEEARIILQEAKKAFIKGDYKAVTVYERTFKDIAQEVAGNNESKEVK